MLLYWSLPTLPFTSKAINVSFLFSLSKIIFWRFAFYYFTVYILHSLSTTWVFWNDIFLWKFPFLESGSIPSPFISQIQNTNRYCVVKLKACIRKCLQTHRIFHFLLHPLQLLCHLFKNINFQSSTSSILFLKIFNFPVLNLNSLAFDSTLNFPFLLTICCILHRPADNVKFILIYGKCINKIYSNALAFSVYREYCRLCYMVSHNKSCIILKTSRLQRL